MTIDLINELQIRAGFLRGICENDPVRLEDAILAAHLIEAVDAAIVATDIKSVFDEFHSLRVEFAAADAAAAADGAA